MDTFLQRKKEKKEGTKEGREKMEGTDAFPSTSLHQNIDGEGRKEGGRKKREERKARAA